MITVCHIASGDLWAGAEAMVLNLLNGLRSYPDVRLKILLLNEGILSQKLRRAGFSVAVLDESRLGPLGLYRGTVRFFQASHPAVIHAHRYKENFLAYLASKRLPAAALVSTQHGLIEKYSAFSSLKQRLINGANLALMARGFQKVVAVSYEMKAALETGYGLAADKIAVIHNGIPWPERAPAADTAKESLIVGSCGRLVPVKDFALMVEIARRVAGHTRKIRFQIAGEGPDKEKLTGLIRGYGLNGTFELLGHVDDMSSFYENIDVFMNTSIHEGIPLSVLEAMSYGCPVIAPQVGGLPEILEDGKAGYLINRRHPDDYADRCLALFGNQGLRLQMANNARSRIKEAFSMETMAREYYRLYRNLAQNA